MLVVGDNEEEPAGVSVRRHGEGDLGSMPPARLPIEYAMRPENPRIAAAILARDEGDAHMTLLQQPTL